MNFKELRRHERILVPGAVQIRVTWGSDGSRADGTATVIGLGGMFVRTKTPPRLASVLHLSVSCPLVSIETECTVRHTNENGMGVEFAGITPENEENLKRLLTQLRV